MVVVVGGGGGRARSRNSVSLHQTVCEADSNLVRPSAYKPSGFSQSQELRFD